MKKVLASGVVVLMVLFLSAGLGLAKGHGAGGGAGGGSGIGGGGGSCGGTGISVICTGEDVTLEGIVTDANTGSGLEISGTDTVYGIGPYWFWENAGMIRPVTGDEVSVNAKKVTFNETTIRIIAMSITVNGGNELQLREPCVVDVGGWPLWSGGRYNN
jgi:hypothetical protein